MMQEMRRMERLKRPKRVYTTVVQSLVGLALLLLPTVGQTATISFTPPLSTGGQGDTFVVDVHIAGAEDLTSWQFDLAYNPSILQANSVTEGPFLSSAGSTLFVPGFIDNTTGLIGGASAFFTDVTPPPSGSGVLASIEFTALSFGLSSLTPSGVILNAFDGSSTIINGSINVSPVPLPSSVVLMAFGMLLLWGLHQWGHTGAQAESRR